MKKVLMTLALLLAAMMLFSCGSDGGLENRTENASFSSVPEAVSGLFINKDCFKGALNDKLCYEIVDETSGGAATKSVTFSGQKYEMNFYDREATRTTCEIVVADAVIKAGTMLRCYDTYKNDSGSITMRAAFPCGDNHPNFIEASGEGVILLAGKTEEQLRSMTENWLFGTFGMKTDGLQYSIRSYFENEVKDGYSAGAIQYFITFKGMTGPIMTAYAAATVRENQVVLLVHNKMNEKYKDKLAAASIDRIEKLTADKITELAPSCKEPSVVITGVPVFSVNGDFAYVEFDAEVTYKKDGVETAEKIVGLITPDLL